ncbi:MAG: hypothetical protein Q7S00_04845, partial [bacterium]|nr:hypothetical protein [bacterium]
MEEHSGQVQTVSMPPEIKGWNWGAFLLNWIWGIGNGTFIALLSLIPCVGIVFPFVLGAKGNEWAWKNKKWESVEQFRSVQKKWALAGAITAAFALVFAGMITVSVFALMKRSDVYQFSLKQVSDNTLVGEAFGQPIDP